MQTATRPPGKTVVIALGGGHDGAGLRGARVMPAVSEGLARHGIPTEGLTSLTVALAADALDLDGGADRQVMNPTVGPIAPGLRLVGWARTVKVCVAEVYPDEPYAGEMAALASLEPGDVLVYQVDPQVRAALFGELFSLAARARGAAGAVLDGPVRDQRQMRDLGFPVFANGVSPFDTRGRAEVIAHDVPVVCGGVETSSGDLVVADDDGVIIVPAAQVTAVVETVGERVSKERGARADLVNGDAVKDVWNRWRVF